MQHVALEADAMLLLSVGTAVPCVVPAPSRQLALPCDWQVTHDALRCTESDCGHELRVRLRADAVLCRCGQVSSSKRLCSLCMPQGHLEY